MNQLTDKEIKLIKKMYKRVVSITPSFVFGALFLFGVIPFSFLTFMYTGDSFNKAAGYIVLTGCLFFTYFIVRFIQVVIGMRGHRWLNVLEKTNYNIKYYNSTYSALGIAGASAYFTGNFMSDFDDDKISYTGDVIQGMAAVAILISIVFGSKDLKKNICSIAQINGVQLKNSHYWLKGFIISLLLILVTVVPEVKKESTDRYEKKLAAQNKVFSIENTLQKLIEDPDSDVIDMDDPLNNCSAPYHVTLRHNVNYDTKWSIYMNVDDKSMLTDVSMSFSIDMEKSVEENLEEFDIALDKLNTFLDTNTVADSDSIFSKGIGNLEEFKEMFRNGTYYDNIVCDVDDNVRVRFHTDSEEKFDKYSDPYFYISIIDEEY